MYFDDLRTYRDTARMKISQLATATGLSRDTISRVEKHFKSSFTTLAKIVDALNENHFNKSGQLIDVNTVITKTSRFGKNDLEA